MYGVGCTICVLKCNQRLGKMGKQKNNKNQVQVTWAQAWRDVMVRAMSNGQLIPITISIILMIAAWRLPEGDLSRLAFSIVDGFKDHALVGLGCACTRYETLFQLRSSKNRERENEVSTETDSSGLGYKR